MGCAGGKQDDVVITSRPKPKLEAVDDLDIDREVRRTWSHVGKGFGRGLDSGKFGFFLVEEPGQDEQIEVIKPYRENFKDLNYETCEESSFPSLNLKLEYIYGYTSYNIRQNLFYLRNPSEIIYSAGTTGVIFNILNSTQKLFSSEIGHKSQISSICLHPDKNTIASSETCKSCKILIWESSYPQRISKTLNLPKSSKSITSLSFSYNGSYLASADLANQIQIWDWQNSSQFFFQTTSQTGILDLAWSQTSCNFSAVGDRFIGIWSYSESKSFNKTECFAESYLYVITCVQWVQSHTYTASKDGKLYKWDGKNMLISEQVHSPFAIHCMTTNDLKIFTGGKDLKVKVLNTMLNVLNSFDLQALPRAIDVRASSILCGLINGNVLEIEPEGIRVLVQGLGDEVKDVAICEKDHEVLISLSGDCGVRVWNCRNHLMTKCRILREKDLNGNLICRTTVMDLGKNSEIIAVGFDDGTLEILEGFSELETKKKVKAANSSIEVLAFSHDCNFLVAGSSDSFIHFFDLPDFSLIKSVFTETTPIKSIDWSSDLKFLRTCCQDFEVLFWDMRNFSILIEEEQSIVGDLYDWNTWTSKAGSVVEGLSSTSPDIFSISTLQRSHSSQFLAVGDHLGQVVIFKYPCLPGARGKALQGHEGNINKIVWGGHDNLIFSCGADRCLVQWRVEI